MSRTINCLSLATKLLRTVRVPSLALVAIIYVLLGAPRASADGDAADLAPGERCFVVGEVLEPDGSHFLANVHRGLLTIDQCSAVAAWVADHGFARRYISPDGSITRDYYYPAHRVLRLEIRPSRAR